MLDDLKLIHQRDKSDALGVAEKQWQQLQHNFGVNLPDISDIQNVVLAGMGGSALPAVLISSWPSLNVPLEVVRNYHIPSYVGPGTLFISSSYSGNTEETLSALDEAEAAGAHIVVIAAGGKLAEHAKQKGYPLFVIPTGVQPRMASFYFVVALIDIFEQLGLAPASSKAELAQTADWLRQELSKRRPDVPTKDNLAKQLALEIVGKTAIIYSGPLLFPAANKFKICLNENAKNLAWVNQYPEFNHNEFIGWSSHPVDKPFTVIEIRSDLEHPRVQKRFEVSERLLSGKRPAPEIVRPQGDTVLKQLLWTMTLGDFVSIYLAILNNVDPTPVELVEKLKVTLDS